MIWLDTPLSLLDERINKRVCWFEYIFLFQSKNGVLTFLSQVDHMIQTGLLSEAQAMRTLLMSRNMSISSTASPTSAAPATDKLTDPSAGWLLVLLLL